MPAQVSAWFQKFVGNHASKLLREAEEIWSDLEEIAAESQEMTPETFEEFQKLRERFEPLWKRLYLVTSTVLKVEYVADAELDAFDAAVDALFEASRTFPELKPIESQ